MLTGQVVQRSEVPVTPSVIGLVQEIESVVQTISALAERLSNAADRTAPPPPREVVAGKGATPAIPVPVALEVRLRGLLGDIERESNRLNEVAERLDAAV